MENISTDEVLERFKIENPWWETGTVGAFFEVMRPRPYLDLFLPLMSDWEVRRAVVLMGPRRVGKTVLLHHAIQALFEEGVSPERICYLSVDNPLYTGLTLKNMLDLFEGSFSDLATETRYVVFDEIQYLRDWEVHLKALVDDRPDIKFIASGSAAAALKIKSQESGAGRFTDFLLPPLTFYEYLDLLDKGDLVQETESAGMSMFTSTDIDEVNREFIKYLNFGGYPEVALSERIQSDPGRFIKSDIIDKVLLRDLPSLYGIRDIQELNYLFSTLAFNTAQELSLEDLAQKSGVAKNTIKKYIEYLEAAFLIRLVHKVGRNSRRFKRARAFKVYLTNPSMRAALFSPVGPEATTQLGSLAETAIFAQWFHSEKIELHYARWKSGEVDIVALHQNQKAAWAVEVKWSDRCATKLDGLGSVLEFCEKSGLEEALVTSKSIVAGWKAQNGTVVTFWPAALYCFTLGYNIIHGKFKDYDQEPTSLHEALLHGPVK